MQTTSPFNHRTVSDRPMHCNVNVLTGLLLAQWKKLTRNDLERTRYNKQGIALLIEQKYGINHVLAENYLTNIERTLPLGA